MVAVVKSAEILSRLEEWSRTRPLQLVVLFGSQATGMTHAHSDVDVAVWPLGAVEPLMKLTWLAELERLLDHDVSLVIVTADLDPVLGMEIVRHGRVIYEAQPELWSGKRLHLWHVYNDSLPFRRALRKQLHEFAEEVRRGS